MAGIVDFPDGQAALGLSPESSGDNEDPVVDARADAAT